MDLCYRHPELDCLIAVMVGAAAEGGRYPVEPPLNASKPQVCKRHRDRDSV